MATPSQKNPAITHMINEMFGIDREAAIRADRCVDPPIGCGGPAHEFRDRASQREFTISGLCQFCQDAMFGMDPI